MRSSRRAVPLGVTDGESVAVPLCVPEPVADAVPVSGAAVR